MNNIAYFPATSQQRDSWHYHNNLPNGHPPQVLIVDAVLENLDSKRLEKAFETMVRKHESLRTFLVEGEDGLCQCVSPYQAASFSPFYYNVSAIDQKEQEIRKLVDAHSWQFKRLDTISLVVCLIFQVSESTSYVCILIHHIMSDEWSRLLIYKEISNLYQDMEKNGFITVQPLKWQLGDYAIWQKNWLEKNGSAITAYWQKKFRAMQKTFAFKSITNQYNKVYNASEVIPPYELAELGEILGKGKAATYTANIQMPLYQRLSALAIHCNATIGAVMYASLQLLFCILTRSNKILLAMPVVDRGKVGAESIIGCLTGGLYLYQDINTEKSMAGFVTDTYLNFLEALSHIIYNHKEMKVDGPLRFCTDVYVNFLSKEITGSGAAEIDHVQKHEPLNGAEYYALSYNISEFTNGLMCVWKYNKQLYRPNIVEYIADEHMRILNDMCDSSQLTLKIWLQKDAHESDVIYL